MVWNCPALRVCRWLVLALPLLPVAGPSVRGAEPVKVFILAGQSNMEGKGSVALLERQLAAPETHDEFAALRPNGEWVSRPDVWIKFWERHGPLTVGYGSPGCIGPELGFGLAVGDRHEAPVLLIKTAWGGRSVFRDFRPPSAGRPPEERLNREFENARKGNADATLDEVRARYGQAYRDMVLEVRETLAGLGALFPEYQGQGYELAGFIWFQGWNDMIDVEATAEYADNLAAMIQDLRRDLGVPGLPVVVGQMGVDGVAGDDNPKMRAFKEAQAAAVQRPEFAGNAALVRTDVFWDQQADAVFRKGWKEHREEWDQVGSNYPYHYLGSVRTMLGIGRALADAALELGAKQAPVRTP